MKMHTLMTSRLAELENEEIKNSIDSLVNKNNKLLELLNCLVDQFDLVPTDWGERCGYCWGWGGEHGDYCAWREAKRYLEGSE